VSVAGDLVSLVPAALEIAKLLKDGDVEKAEKKTKALAQSIALKKATRVAAKAAGKALKK
jgi:hypothetical protein